MKLTDIHIRDPYVLLYNGKYYMYGTNGAYAFGKGSVLHVYTSDDLVEWSEPRVVFSPSKDFWADQDFWAPEVHEYNGLFYMLVSFKSEKRHRGTQILCADSPSGPFEPISDGPVTQEDWECLDGTLCVEDGTPYLIFCHEWTQINDGEICAVELSADLKIANSSPFLLFRASDNKQMRPVRDDDKFVTDGPFIYKHTNGSLLLIWSSFSDEGYCEAIAYSESGKISGPWKHFDELLFSRDGGHGMIFKDKEGSLKFIMHSPNNQPNERPKLSEIKETENSIALK